MSIWGKVIGGVAGFAMGGPFGALLGAVAGHAVDKMRGAQAEAAPPPSSPADLTASRQAAFAIAMIVLSAKMAKADGQVTRDEIAAFREIFQIPPGEMKNVARLWDGARDSAEGYEPYARQVADMFAGNPALLEELLAGLMHIAKADGVIHPGELDYLRGVAAIFGFEGAAFERVRETHIGRPEESDPYSVLDVPPDISDDDLKKAYRKLIRENHPDTLMAQGLPKEMVDLANEKMAAINAAYDSIAKRRGLN